MEKSPGCQVLKHRYQSYNSGLLEEIIISERIAAINETRPASRMAIWAAMGAIYIVWGSTYLAIRFAVATIPPFYMASARFLMAGSILFLFRRLAGDPLPTWKEWRSAGIIGLFLLLGGNGGVVWAEQRVPSSLAALMVGTVPLWMVLVDALKPG